MLRRITNSIMNHVLSGRDFFLDLLFPLYCCHCGQEGTRICPDCLASIQSARADLCPDCRNIESDGFCAICHEKHFIADLWISTDYDDQRIMKLIKDYKYAFSAELSLTLAKLMLSSLDNIKRADHVIATKPLLIPIPLHPKRLRMRGFNQSALLAKELSQALGLPIATDELVRKRETRSQARLAREERLENVKDAFLWQGDDLTDKTIILIDDVASTGATLDNCAKTLLAHNAKEVIGWVLAKN